MPLIIPVGYANIIVSISNGSGGPSAYSSIGIGVKLTVALTQPDVETLATAIKDRLAQLYDQSWFIGPFKVIEGTLLGEKVWLSNSFALGALNNTAYAPPAVAQVVGKLSAFGGRQHRGRFYLPGVPEVEIDEAGIVSAPRVAVVQQRINEMKDQLELTPVVDWLALFHDSTSPAGPPDRITDLVVRPTVGTVRPRQRR